MLTHALLYDVSDVLKRRCQLLEFIVAKSDVVGDIALITSDVERLLELGLSILILLLLVKDATLSDNSLG